MVRKVVMDLTSFFLCNLLRAAHVENPLKGFWCPESPLELLASHGALLLAGKSVPKQLPFHMAWSVTAFEVHAESARSWQCRSLVLISFRLKGGIFKGSLYRSLGEVRQRTSSGCGTLLATAVGGCWLQQLILSSQRGQTTCHPPEDWLLSR